MLVFCLMLLLMSTQCSIQLCDNASDQKKNLRTMSLKVKSLSNSLSETMNLSVEEVLDWIVSRLRNVGEHLLQTH
ncbi:hypothetical protein M514_22849 [Trichuris suis]|uniref:Uncharacterized protein n=1 Tax=Trichuris suis TaxID=68888 RepID=A0A085N6A4_9BILA|nr:hypothetical protein M514_22849 [Trichuris suis]